LIAALGDVVVACVPRENVRIAGACPFVTRALLVDERAFDIRVVSREILDVRIAFEAGVVGPVVMFNDGGSLSEFKPSYDATSRSHGTIYSHLSIIE
jgi:hypothetical protein